MRTLYLISSLLLITSSLCSCSAPANPCSDSNKEQAEKLLNQAIDQPDSEGRVDLLKQIAPACYDTNILMLLGDSKIELHHEDDAIIDLNQALKLVKPNSIGQAEIYALLAKAYLSLNNRPLAMANISKGEDILRSLLDPKHDPKKKKSLAVLLEGQNTIFSDVLRDLTKSTLQVALTTEEIQTKLDSDERAEAMPKIDIPILFAYDKADLTQEGRDQSEKPATALTDFVKQGWQVYVIGHTDSKGSDAYNQTLSEQRAATVMQFLTQRFPKQQTQFKAAGKGETELKFIAKNDQDEATHRLNRRVEINILK